MNFVQSLIQAFVDVKFFQLEYLTIIISHIAIAILFFNTRNGWLRKLLIAYFSSVVFCTGIALVVFTFKWNTEFIMSVALLPITIVSVVLVFFLFKNYTKLF